MFLKDYTKRSRKKVRVRKHISGTAERPRLSVFRSLSNVYAQLIDDENSTTLLSASTISKEIKEDLKNAKNKTEQGKKIGEFLAKKAIEKGITTVVFDRSGYRYHGRIKAVAEGAREGGLKF